MWSANVCWAVLSNGTQGDFEQMGLAGWVGLRVVHIRHMTCVTSPFWGRSSPYMLLGS